MKLRRRDLLLGIGAGASLFAPMLRRQRAHAAGKPGVGNFISYFTPNGFVRSRFGSDGDGASFKLRPSLSPATPVIDNLTVVRGLSNKSQQPQKPFHDQISRYMTCRSGPTTVLAYGPSIDHRIAALTDTEALILSVYWWRGPDDMMKISWKDKFALAPHINDSKKAYALVFGALAPSGTSEEVNATLARDKSLLDFVLEDIQIYRGRLQASERVRVDQHLEAIRRLETKLKEPPEMDGACPRDMASAATTFEEPRTGAELGNPDARFTVTDKTREKGTRERELFLRHYDIQTDLIAATLACGLRNSITLVNQRPGAGINLTLNARGRAEEHHWASHGDYGDGEWAEIDKAYAGRFTELVEKLREVDVLGQTVVVWGSEIAQSHSHNNCTFVVAGGRDLGIQHRKTLDFPFVGNEGGGLAAARNGANASISDIWTSALRACGAPDETFGEHSTGGVPGLWKPV